MPTNSSSCLYTIENTVAESKVLDQDLDQSRNMERGKASKRLHKAALYSGSDHTQIGGPSCSKGGWHSGGGQHYQGESEALGDWTSRLFSTLSSLPSKGWIEESSWEVETTRCRDRRLVPASYASERRGTRGFRVKKSRSPVP